MSEHASPLVSVVVTTRDREAELRACIEGVRAEMAKAGANGEIVIVDASREGSAVWCRSVEETVYLSVPAGPVGGNRPTAALAGLRAARAAIVCLVDDDAVPRPGWLSALLEAFATHPEVGMVGGRVALGGDSKPVVARVDQAGRLAWSGFNSSVGDSEVDFLAGGNLAVRAEALKALEDLDLSVYTARNWRWETELCVRVARNGWKLLYEGGAVVDHLPVAPPRMVNPRERFGMARNEALFALRLYPGMRTALVHLFVEPVRELSRSFALAGAGVLAGAASAVGRWVGVVVALVDRENGRKGRRGT